MRAAHFTIRIQIPEEIEEPTSMEIVEAMVDGDTPEQGILRWLSGGVLSEAEDVVNSQLPEGWYCKIEHGGLR